MSSKKSTKNKRSTRKKSSTKKKSAAKKKTSRVSAKKPAARKLPAGISRIDQATTRTHGFFVRVGYHRTREGKWRPKKRSFFGDAGHGGKAKSLKAATKWLKGTSKVIVGKTKADVQSRHGGGGGHRPHGGGGGH